VLLLTVNSAGCTIPSVIPVGATSTPSAARQPWIVTECSFLHAVLSGMPALAGMLQCCLLRCADTYIACAALSCMNCTCCNHVPLGLPAGLCCSESHICVCH
jgi:hypothetical protein